MIRTTTLSEGVSATLLLAILSLAGCADSSAPSHESFESPDAAVSALVEALEKNDSVSLQRVLGPDSQSLLASGDAVRDSSDRENFIAAYRQAHRLVPDGVDSQTLEIGESQWPFPVPLSRRDGRWYLDGALGADELALRRIGRNELGAINVCRGFVEAQREYASLGRDGDEAGIFALKLISDEGLHNGLYWKTVQDEPVSPAGDFVAAAAAEGYRGPAAVQPYHGYRYRMLYKQGGNANGGARDYFKDGLLTEGFALVAWPAEYGVSGIMTFIVNADGVVFQKDLGEDSADAVERLESFDPDSSWVAIVEQPQG